MLFRILTTMLLGSILVCFSQDQIILRNKDTINCKLTNLDQYYTYFIAAESNTHILQVSNVHVKKIHNKTFTKQKEWLFPNKDTSDYKTSNKITTTKFKKIPESQQVQKTVTAAPQAKTVADSSQTPVVKAEQSFFLASFSILPINAGLTINNASSFRYISTGHGSFALNFEWVSPNSIGFSAYGGYSTYSYYAAFTSPDRTLNASFQKKESGAVVGIGPNVSYRTSKSSFIKANVGLEGLIKPKLKFKETQLSRVNQTFDNSHTGDQTHSSSKVGINLGLSYHKQLTDFLVLAFGVGYKGMKQKFLITNKLQNDAGNLEINDTIGFQTEHFLTSFLSIGAQF